MPLDCVTTTYHDPAFETAEGSAAKTTREKRPTSRFWTDEDLAARLGKSRNWLRQNRKLLEKQGMPQRDELFGYDSVAIEHWLDVRAGLREPSVENEEQKALELIKARRCAK